MNFDLDRAGSRAERERNKRKQDAHKKLEQAKAAKSRAVIQQRRIEEAQQDRRLERVRAEQAEEERIRLHRERTGGVNYNQVLEPYPLPLAATERIVLPPSALETCMAQNALENNPGPLTFHLTLLNSAGETLASTHAGVSEFIAPEGTVGIPPKTALSLTRERGLQSLTSDVSVRVEYVVLSQFTKSFTRIQPRGHGFHEQGKDVVNLDLRQVLERTLREHMAVTKGDWIPIRHEGITYEMVVMDVEPADALLLLNTDLEVDIMPSQVAERQIQQKEEEERQRQQMEERAQEIHEQHRQFAHAKAETLPPIPDADTDVNLKMKIRARLPDGSTRQRAFHRSETLVSSVFDWVASETPDLIPPSWRGGAQFCTCGQKDVASSSSSPHSVGCPLEYGFVLVQSWSGHRVEIGIDEGSKTLSAAGLTGRQESLHVVWLRDSQQAGSRNSISSKAVAAEAAADSSGDGVAGNDEDGGSGGGEQNKWEDAAMEAVNKFDDQLMVEGLAAAKEDGNDSSAKDPHLHGEELASLFKRIVSGGVHPPDAAALAQRHGVAIQELESMGFTQYATMGDLLNKYQGRIIRVANALAEAAVQEADSADVFSSSEGVDSAGASAAAVDDVVMSNGNTGADLSADQESLLDEMVDNGKMEVEAAGAAVAAFGKQLTELRAMGFTDYVHIVTLLQKYQGRVDRVANILVGGG